MSDEMLVQRLERIEQMALLAAKNVLDTDDVARLTGYSPAYIEKMVSRREIPFYKRGNRRFFNRAEIEDWMQQQRVPTMDEMASRAV